jgi:hypothetical protein
LTSIEALEVLASIEVGKTVDGVKVDGKSMREDVP